VLRAVVAPVVRRALGSGAADQWFFVRYADPDRHLRLRLRGVPSQLLSSVLPRLEHAARAFVEDGRIFRMELGTYEREMERYHGDAGMEASEALFFADSDSVLEIIETPAGEDLDARWRLALRGADQLLEDLGLGLDEKRALVRTARDGFAREHDAQPALERQMDALYRRERPALEALLASPLEAFGARTARVRRIAADLRAAGVPVARVAPSYVHMHVNRLIRSEARAHELVLYDLLSRLYDGQAARSTSRRSGSRA
jgi:lantibiotic biosynthesis protein